MRQAPAFLAALFFAATLSASASVEAGDVKRALEATSARGWPGAAVLVERADGVTISAAVGLANLETGAPMKSDSGFHMCSINKTFTTAAVLRLVDQGKVALEQKVLAVLDLPVVRRIPHIEAITVGQLLDHSSGIYPTNNDPAYLESILGGGAFDKRVWRPEELVELATRPENKPTSKPGEGHHYSDTNYVLLGMIVKRVAGESYKAHIARMLLTPLGMSATYFYSDILEGKREMPEGVANGYLKLSKELRDAVRINPAFASPRQGWLNTSVAAERIDAAGGMITTLPDLRKFAAALFRGKLLSAKSQRVLETVQLEMSSAEIGAKKTRALQGSMTKFGFVLYKEGDGPGGFNTLMAFHPALGTIFLGFANQFGDFNEVDVMMDEVMGAAVAQ